MKVICFDLDDTLYKEIDFLMSAFKEVVAFAINSASKPCDFNAVYNTAIGAYLRGDNAFGTINDICSLHLDYSVYLDIYRNHKPKILLDSDAYELLASIKKSSDKIGLITDGRSVQQRNKISALGLFEFVDNDDIVISEEFGSEKPSLANYKYFMERYPFADDFIYVGDNIKKDFLTPNKLNWKTICLLDDGRNIHKQDFSQSKEFLPTLVVRNLSEFNL